jgi:hypothetical protein
VLPNLSMRAPGQYAWRLAPRLGAAIGAWGGSAQSARASGPDEPVILGKRASAQPLPQCHARRGPRGPREGQAGELQGAASPLSNFVKPVRRDAAATAAQRLADLRALRDDQRAKEAEVADQEAEHRQRPMRTDGLRMRGQAQWMWPCLCCMLHAGCGPDAVWAVAGWGKGRMRRTLLGRWQVGAEAACG